MPSSDYFGCTEIFLLSRGSVGQGGVGGGALSVPDAGAQIRTSEGVGNFIVTAGDF